MKITRSILLIAFLMLFYRAFGQPAERLIRIQITPNHTDWLYKPGEKIKPQIRNRPHKMTQRSKR